MHGIWKVLKKIVNIQRAGLLWGGHVQRFVKPPWYLLSNSTQNVLDFNVVISGQLVLLCCQICLPIIKQFTLYAGTTQQSLPICESVHHNIGIHGQ